jgi:hypothetical protein
MPNHNRTKPSRAGAWPRWGLLSAGVIQGNLGRSRWANYQRREAAFPNDIKGDSDGSKRIQTATGGDNPRTAGETPTTDLTKHMRTTEAKRGR